MNNLSNRKILSDFDMNVKPDLARNFFSESKSLRNSNHVLRAILFQFSNTTRISYIQFITAH